ncbi:MAG: hypothetical protein H7320_11975 [Ferruginibacter sp.]|nr:hypothetical protein [Ferruginibacter sp.]
MLLPGKPTYEPKNLMSSQDTIYNKKVNAYVSEIKLLSGYIISIPFVLLFSYLFYNIANSDTVILWGKEDSFFEWLTALFYFISFVLLLLTFKKNRNIFLVLLGMVMLFGAGEEISWGQRIFGFATPEEINKLNVQHEFNIHNLVIFNGKYMNGELKTGLSRFFEIDMLFKIFTIFFGLVLPFCVYHFKFIASLTKKFKIPVPPISIGIFFAISWIGLKLSLAAIPLEKNTTHYWRIYMAGPEIAEFVSAYIMAVVSLYFYNNRNKNIMGKDFKQLIAS